MNDFEIFLSEPNLNGNEKKYVAQAIDSEWVSITGPFVKKLGNVVEEYIGAKHAIPVQNATAALHMSLLIQGIKAGDEVIVPTLSFIASVNCVKYIGAEPVFMDCDDYGNMDVAKLKQFCENNCNQTEKGLINKDTDRIITAIIVTHVFGNAADMFSIMEIAKQYNLKVIEDSAQSIGTYYTKGTYKGRHTGTIGDCGVYSFNSNKIITTGSGGILVIKDEELARKAEYLITQAKDDPIRYKHNNVGYNYMMNNIQAAMGVAQMEQLEGFISHKESNYLKYKQEFEDIDGIELLPFSDGCRPNYWFYTIKVEEKQFGLTRNQLMDGLQEHGIQTRPLWGLIHKQKPYQNNVAYKIEKAEYYSNHLLNIPCGSKLTEEQVQKVVDVIKLLQENNRV